MSMLHGVQRQLTRWYDWFQALGDLRGDALLYTCSAVFAVGTWRVSTTLAESRWGLLAAPGYVCAALVAVVISRRVVSRPQLLRAILTGVVIVLTLLMPLAVEAQLRHMHPTGNFAQPEVMVIERAGQLVDNGTTPYQSYWHDGTLVHRVPSIPAYESFFPYLPLMAVFGVPAAIGQHGTPLTDARVAMTITTMLCLAGGLWLLRLPARRSLRLVQMMLALPSGALFLATGGDDLPILGLMFLGVAFMVRRRHLSAACTIAVAAAMKFTVWPLALGALLVNRDASGRLKWGQTLFIIASVVVLTTGPVFAAGQNAFVANVVLFPAGLAHVASPATSDFPGHLLSVLWPPLGRALQLAVVASAVLFVRYIHRHWPLDAARMLSLLAVASALIIGSATATRFGYVIYPINFWLWARTLRATSD